MWDLGEGGGEDIPFRDADLCGFCEDLVWGRGGGDEGCDVGD